MCIYTRSCAASIFLMNIIEILLLCAPKNKGNFILAELQLKKQYKRLRKNVGFYYI